MSVVAQRNVLSRRLILVDGSGLDGKSLPLAVLIDFFRDSIGGGWRDDEVNMLSGPALSKTSVASHLAAQTPNDYCVAVCVGRVAHVKADRPWQETHLILPNGEHVSERELNSGSPRMLLIFDGGSPGDAETERKTRDGGSTSQNRSARSDAYDCALLAAEEGVVKLSYFTPKKHSLVDFSLSSALVSVARTWAETQTGVLCLDRAFEQIQLSGQPARELEYNSGRRMRHFPLAVS
jgi:hypothetical protein